MGMLDSKIIVVTGGSMGIGFAVAKKCVQEGATAIIAARNRRDLSKALTELNKISRKNHSLYSLDVSDLNKVKAFAQWCRSYYAVIHGLVNCAGIYGPIGKATDVDMSEFKKAIHINFLGTVYMCTVFAKAMSAGIKNKIVNYSGGGAASSFANYSAYAVSKAAIVRFTENLALELAEDNIEVNCVAPGFVNTRLHAQTLAAGEGRAGKTFFEYTKNQIASGKASPEKSAALTVFLLSQESDGITGKFISAVWDPWNTPEFRSSLRKDKDFAALRRIDNKRFFQKI